MIRRLLSIAFYQNILYLGLRSFDRTTGSGLFSNLRKTLGKLAAMLTENSVYLNLKREKVCGVF